MRSPDNMDELIATVARRANVSHQSATQAVDTVLTAVKDKLPDNMAKSLVRVMAGEDSFNPADARAATPRATTTSSNTSTSSNSTTSSAGSTHRAASSTGRYTRGGSATGTASGGAGGSSTSGASGRATSGKAKVEDVTEKVGETVADVSETVKEVGGKAFEEVGRVGSKAFDELGTTANRLSRWAKDFIDKQKK